MFSFFIGKILFVIFNAKLVVPLKVTFEAFADYLFIFATFVKKIPQVVSIVDSRTLFGSFFYS